MNNYMLLVHQLLVHSLLLLCLATLAFGANRLSADEVQALKDIAKTLGKTNWNFSADPCSGEYGWITQADKYFANNVTCGNCTTSDAANDTRTDQICHVVSILLRAQNLPGTLPSELARLPYLQQIDLARNYLNGTIPPQWGSLPLVNISLVGNRLTGSIPVELANITTLKSLTMDFNYFSGGLPWELGFLPSIETLILTSNNFTGELPDTFAKLTKLKDFRIIDNSFSGKIPNYIQNWTNLKKLGIQASGLTGPIPSGISLLTSLTDLRITDLNGPESSFPLLENMKNLKILMLRSCNINGQLPEYFSDMTELTTLDLSFNRLTGNVPRSFVASRNNLDYIFLTGNLLNGSEPLWMVGENVDLSYNNFTITAGPVNCRPQASWNLFASSSKGNSSAVSCLSNKTTTCSKSWYSLNINCGGSGVTVNGIAYDEDTDANGPSSYYMSSTNWVSSSTGYFPDDDSSTDHFT
ncbi:hypothetical protein ABKV19_005321 [Rosa sericea]